MKKDKPAGTKNASLISGLEKRENDTDLLILVELDASTVEEQASVRLDDGYVVSDIITSGTMRESCPECQTGNLKLVLLGKRATKAHANCELCGRYFDAYHPDGTLALLLD